MDMRGNHKKSTIDSSRSKKKGTGERDLPSLCRRNLLHLTLLQTLRVRGLSGATSGADDARVAVVLSSDGDFCVEPDVVVCELAHLSVVDADDLGFFVATETKTGDVMHDP